ncbi:hypothetical protein KEM52_000554 [Ascosphaera acerosa]|nr:hypothetical protein KEM52_000554 [Ascosphaera acerosa]
MSAYSSDCVRQGEVTGHDEQRISVDRPLDPPSARPEAVDDATATARRRQHAHAGHQHLAHATDVLETYLPPHLRYGEQQSQSSLQQRSDSAGQPSDDGSTVAKRWHDLERLLRRARTKADEELLAYLAVDRDRWPAAHHLLNQLLDHATAWKSAHHVGWLPCNLDWPRGLTLDAVSDFKHAEAGRAELPALAAPAPRAGANARGVAPLADLDDYLEDPVMRDPHHPTAYAAIMGHVWATLGAILVKTADLPPEQARRSLAHVRRILARMHHDNLIPDDVYRYHGGSADISETVTPTRNAALSLLASRIMNDLSEAQFNAPSPAEPHGGRRREQAMPASDDATHSSQMPTHTQPPAPVEPSIFGFRLRQRRLGVEIWLEFILRCCIEAGFADEGLWILRGMGKPTGNESWRIVYPPPLLSSPDQAARFNTGLIDCYDTWDECAASTGGKVDAYPDRPFVGIRARAVGRDTVMCLLDAVLNGLTVGVGVTGDAATSTIGRVQAVLQRLTCHDVGLTAREARHVAVRTLQARSVIVEVNPDAAKKLLDLMLSVEQWGAGRPHGVQLALAPSTDGFAQGFSHYIFDALAASGRIRKVQEMLQLRLPSPDESPNVPAAAPSQLSLALMLRACAASQCYGLGLTLLDNASRASQNSVLPAALLRSEVLVPALIRFAAASGRHDLIQQLGAYHAGNWTTASIKALLEYTIQDEDWANAERLLLHLRDQREAHWGVSQVMLVAATIVRLEGRASGHGQCSPSSQPARPDQATDSATAADSTHRGLDFLARVLRGHYAVVIEYPDHTRSDYQDLVLWELHQLLLTVPGVVSRFCQSFRVPPPRRGVPQHRAVPPDAFNRLLAAVVETHGAKAGREMWRRWCIEPCELPSRQVVGDGTRQLYAFRPATRRTSHRYRSSERRSGGEELAATGGGGIGGDGAGSRGTAASATATVSRTKLVTPNITTLRIIARQALRELAVLDQSLDQDHDIEQQRQQHPDEDRNEALTAGTEDASVSAAATISSINTSKRHMARRILSWAAQTARQFNCSQQDWQVELSAPASSHVDRQHGT